MKLESLPAFRDDFEEYFWRSSFFVSQAKSAVNDQLKSCFILSAIYNLQAAFEVAMGAVSFSPDRDETKDARKEFLELASSKVRYLFLIDVLRSHDFHRHAVTFRTGGVGVYGPIKMSAHQQGEVHAITPDESGRFTSYRMKEGKEIAQPHRRDDTVQIRNFDILEPVSGQWMPILEILEEHQSDLMALLLASNTQSSSGSANST